MKTLLALLLFAACAAVYGWLQSGATVRRCAIALAAFMALGMAAPARAQDIRVIRVIDGDTFEMDGETIRLWGIDAPEMTGACAEHGVSARWLMVTGLRGSVRCEMPPDGQDRDRYGRWRLGRRHLPVGLVDRLRPPRSHHADPTLQHLQIVLAPGA